MEDHCQILTWSDGTCLWNPHECNANHAQSNDHDLLSFLRRPWILGSVFFWVMAIDRSLASLHARGGVCPRHLGVVNTTKLEKDG